MKSRLLGSAAIVALIGAGSAHAGDAFTRAASVYPYNWNGFYVGLNVGAGWGSYNFNTSTAPNTYLPSPADSAAVNAAGALAAKPSGFGGGVQAGYNWQSGPWVAGIEADYDYMHMRGLATSNAVRYPVGPGVFVTGNVNGILIAAPINQFVITDYADTDWLATLRPRLGYAQGNWLYYVTGGLALTQLKADMLFTDGVAALALGLEQEARINDVLKFGTVVGAGVEAGLTNNLSVKAEYLHVNFGTTGALQTLNTVAVLAPGKNQTFADSIRFSADILRLGLNYRFGGADPVGSDPPIIALKAPVWKAPPQLNAASAWEFEAGTRLWFSNGTVGAPQPLLGAPPLPSMLISRLAYAGLDALSGETFARLDHSSGLFVKGNLGAGGITRGELYDEDFPAGNAYSNTIESHAQGDIAYATIDLGYNFVTAPGAKLGAFVGYNYYTQEINTYGCIQLAGATGCGPGAVSPNILGISEADHFNSLRVGLSSQVMLTDRLRLTADAAYLPWVDFEGLNHHNARELLLPEAANNGDGVMLEAILGYRITDAWNIGVGGRYWAWNTNTGTVSFENLGLPGPLPPAQLARYTTERYGLFLQASYRWGDTTPPVAVASTGLPTKAPPLLAPPPTNWTGLYLGGHLGGGRSEDRWSDPFGASPGTSGAVNLPDFGDTINATGPLGGGQIGANWQTGPLVLGVQADASAAHIRGENTCFSGLGGINCQRVINSLETFTGRVGYAWGRSLAYVNGGGARTDDTYTLNGNTNGALALGIGSSTLNTWGWTVGGGFEYAVTNHWTALAEYDHVGIPSTTVPFPTVTVVNAQTIGVKQAIDLFKLGVNYKFDLASLGASGPSN
jgi:opacity protein-like surface antigen